MTDKLREQVSALVDNELDAGQTDLLLRRIGADPDLRGTVERYVLMGEAIRDALAPARMGEFADQVMAKIGKGADSGRVTVPSHTVAMVAKAAGGFAVAATVATIAILSLQGEPKPTTLTYQPEGGAEIVPPPPSERPDAAQMRLTAYLLSHSEYSTSMGPKGMLTRIVSHADFDVPNEDVEDEMEQDDQATEQQQQ